MLTGEFDQRRRLFFELDIVVDPILVGIDFCWLFRIPQWNKIESRLFYKGVISLIAVPESEQSITSRSYSRIVPGGESNVHAVVWVQGIGNNPSQIVSEDRPWPKIHCPYRRDALSQTRQTMHRRIYQWNLPLLSDQGINSVNGVTALLHDDLSSTSGGNCSGHHIIVSSSLSYNHSLFHPCNIFDQTDFPLLYSSHQPSSAVTKCGETRILSLGNSYRSNQPL
jgi:hypothetical protein